MNSENTLQSSVPDWRWEQFNIYIYIHAYKNSYIYKTGKNTVRLSLSVSCVSPPLVPIFGQFLFLSSFVIISSQPCVFSWLVLSPVLLIILFAPSFPSLYKSSVFPVSLSSINVIPQCPVGMCTCAPAISLYLNKVCEGSSTSPRSWHPRTPWQNTGPQQLIFLHSDEVHRRLQLTEPGVCGKSAAIRG